MTQERNDAGTQRTHAHHLRNPHHTHIKVTHPYGLSHTLLSSSLCLLREREKESICPLPLSCIYTSLLLMQCLLMTIMRSSRTPSLMHHLLVISIYHIEFKAFFCLRILFFICCKGSVLFLDSCSSLLPYRNDLSLYLIYLRLLPSSLRRLEIILYNTDCK